MGDGFQEPLHGRDKTLEVEWTTISYRTIAAYVVLALVLVGFIFYLIAPNFSTRIVKRTFASISVGLVGKNTVDAATAKREARFVNLDGAVRIKKAQSVEWLRADYNTTLEKGDFVQTASDGVARIIFADGTQYTLKPDSLLVVEESQEDPVTRATRVAVQVSSGAVDLSTGKFEIPGSTSRVSFEDATASLAELSRAAVRNDPQRKVHEFTVDQGQAEITRGATTLRLGQYEQAVFVRERPGLIRQKVIAPPTLVSPPNMSLTVTADPKATAIDFAWEPVPEAVAYRLQVAANGIFSNLIVDRKVAGALTARVTGLEEGTYYWVVRSIDASGVESQPPLANRFNLVQQVEAGRQAYLEVTGLTVHGKVVEVRGRTEPGSMVIVNNEQVFSIAADGTFRHFTIPFLKPGSNQVTVTAQNRRGDTNTIRKTVVMD